MTPISTNATNTVGLVDMHNPKEDFIMSVNPLLLKQWADMVLEHFAGENHVYLSVHKNRDPMVTAKVLCAASEYGDELQVALCGTDNDDVVKKKGGLR